jgi:hypothetical protein
MQREVPGIATLLTHIESEPATIAEAAQIDPSKNLETSCVRRRVIFRRSWISTRSR